jgi:hypothetical protein
MEHHDHLLKKSSCARDEFRCESNSIKAQRAMLQTVLLLSAGTVMTALLGSEHWLGWLLVGLTLVLPLGAASVRSDWRLATVVYLVIGCQHGFAFLMTFGKFRPLDLWDASYFDTLASWAAQAPGLSLTWELGYVTYVNLLSHVYRINNTFFTGAEVCIVFSVVSLLLAIRIARDLGVAERRLWWVAVAGLIPGSLVHLSVTYRESWQLMFLMLAICAAVRLLVRGDARWLGVLCPAVVLMGVLQKALFLYALCMIVLVGIFMIFTLRRTIVRWGVSIGIIIAVLIMTTVIWTTPTLAGFFEPMIRLIDPDILGQISDYRERMVNNGAPRTDYGIRYSWSDTASIVMTLGSMYLHYLFAPFDGIDRWVDLYPIAESVLRFVLLACVFRGLLLGSYQQRAAILFLIMIYLSMTLLWSIGTTNYGQGIRHHVLTNWMLFVLTAAVHKFAPKPMRKS